MGLLDYSPFAARNGLIFGGVRGLYSVCKKSRLEIGRGSKGKRVKIRVINSHVRIGENCDLGSLKITAINCKIEIGDNTQFVGYSDITSTEGCDIYIGKNCLIADGCWITASDLHPIHDVLNGERLNGSKPITIENGVWLAREVAVLKGAIIRNGSAVGLRSVVTKEIPAHCLAVGIPAKPVKSNIRWQR